MWVEDEFVVAFGWFGVLREGKGGDAKKMLSGNAIN